MSCSCHTCLRFIDPACIMTMFWNKALHMDPHVSRLVRPVTEYSATQGSSNFSDQHFSGMDTTRLLFALKQGPRSLENHIREFLAFAHYSDLPDIILMMEIFCDGINQPLRSQLRREGPRSSLSCFLDFALLTVGSLFTVGVADEDRDTVSMTEMVDAPECAHKMAVTAEPVHKMAATTTPRHVSAASHESIQVTVDVKELSKVSVDVNETSQVTIDRHKSSHVSADRHESGQVTVDRRETSQVTFDRRESSQVTADVKRPSQVTAIVKEPSQVTADVNEPSEATFDLRKSIQAAVDLRESSQTTVDRHESIHLTADQPESHHVTADQPESHHITADQPESLHVSAEMPESVTPRDLRSVLRVPCLVSSVRDAQLVSARAAGIPKPTHFSPPVPELIPLPVVLPTMGIALWCIWAAYTTTEILETAAATKMSPEVAADAAEPPGVVVHAAVFPEATPAAVSPEVAADAAEPTEAAVLPLIPCMVVAPSNALAACQVTVKGTITELSASVETQDGTAVEPLEVAASTAEPPEVSVVSTCQFLPCPVTAKKAICELSPCPDMAKEAVCELSPCPVTARKAVCELSPCPVTAKEAVCELSPCPVTAKEAACELSPCPVTAKEAVCDSLSYPVLAMEAACDSLSCPYVTAMEAVCDSLSCHGYGGRL